MTGLGETFAAVVTDGSLRLAFAVAALVGLISFASPCCLLLVPGYVSYMAGRAGADAAAGTTHSRRVRLSALPARAGMP